MTRKGVEKHMTHFVAHVPTDPGPALQAHSLAGLNQQIHERIKEVKETRNSLLLYVSFFYSVFCLSTIAFLVNMVSTGNIGESVGAYLFLMFLVFALGMPIFHHEFGIWIPRLQDVYVFHQTYVQWNIELGRQNAPDVLIAMR